MLNYVKLIEICIKLYIKVLKNGKLANLAAVSCRKPFTPASLPAPPSTCAAATATAAATAAAAVSLNCIEWQWNALLAVTDGTA